MAWNEPGGGNKDPWGGNKGGGNNQGPPDLDEAFRKLQEKLGGLFGGGSNKSSKPNPGSGILIGGLIVIVLVVYLWSAVFKLDEKEKAVILQFGKYHETVGAGLHLYFPPLQKKFSQNTQQLRTYHLNQQMLTQDENIVDVSLSVQYNISSIKDYVMNVADPDLSLREATQSALRHEVGSAKMIPILTDGREKLQIDVQNRLRSYMQDYKTGIDVIQVNIEKTSPPQDVQSAFDDVIRAREDEQHFKNKARAYSAKVVPEAQGQAARILEEAQAYQESIIAKAQGEAARFTKVLKAYQKAPKVTRERLYLDTMQEVLGDSNKVLLDVKQGNNMIYLPVDQMMKNKANASSSGGGAALSNQELGDLTEQLLNKLNQSKAEVKTGRSAR